MVTATAMAIFSGDIPGALVRIRGANPARPGGMRALVTLATPDQATARRNHYNAARPPPAHRSLDLRLAPGRPPLDRCLAG